MRRHLATAVAADAQKRQALALGGIVQRMQRTRHVEARGDDPVGKPGMGPCHRARREGARGEGVRERLAALAPGLCQHRDGGAARGHRVPGLGHGSLELPCHGLGVEYVARRKDQILRRVGRVGLREGRRLRSRRRGSLWEQGQG